MFLLDSVPMALSAAACPWVGMLWATGKFERAREVIRQALRSGALWGVTCIVGLSLSASGVARLLSSSAGVAHILERCLWILPLGLLPYTRVLVTIDVYNHLGRASRAAALALIRSFGLCVPLAMAGHHVTGLYGVVLSLPLARALTALMAARWFSNDRITLRQHLPEGAAATSSQRI
jgi:Na+-driven multidrug efflux pump